MAFSITDLKSILNHRHDTVIDVRAPAEFAQDHIPGAINLPVLDDAQRAHIGTIYKQDCAFNAKKLGAALVARNAAAHIEGPLANKDGAWRPLVYCWRGGQRSASFATILSQIGWRVNVIDGGYKSYRRHVVAAMHDSHLCHDLIVLDGNTGTAKTELLLQLRTRGEQVIDLEGLAAHRGSIFGATRQPQPSQKAFEGALAQALAGFDTDRPVWVEAESSKIGRLLVPPALWQAMTAAPRISVSAPLAARAEYLLRAYANIAQDPVALNGRLTALTAHQGHERVDAWHALADAGQLQTLAHELMQFHYDPSYARSGARRKFNVLGQVHIPKFWMRQRCLGWPINCCSWSSRPRRVRRF